MNKIINGKEYKIAPGAYLSGANLSDEDTPCPCEHECDLDTSKCAPVPDGGGR